MKIKAVKKYYQTLPKRSWHCFFISNHGMYDPVGQFDDDIASIGIFKSEERNFRFHIAYPHSKDYDTMNVDACFREARVQLPNDERHHFFA